MLEIFELGGIFSRSYLRDFADEFALGVWGVRVVRDSAGRPFLEGFSQKVVPHISISHTAQFWAILSSEHSCGLDIELVGRCAGHLVGKFAMVGEVELCVDVFPQNPSLLVWCAKEAVYKYVGDGDLELRGGIKIVGASDGGLTAVVTETQQTVELEWCVDTRFSEELLVVKTV